MSTGPTVAGAHLEIKMTSAAGREEGLSRHYRAWRGESDGDTALVGKKRATIPDGDRGRAQRIVSRLTPAVLPANIGRHRLIWIKTAIRFVK